MITQATEVLKEYFGYEEFRPHQSELIEQVLSGRDVLGVMPTGAGKSLVFQVPALLSSGLTLVVSPLISLMKDQVDALRQAGVRAAFLNSSLLPFEQDELLSHAAKGGYQLLYVAPERLENAQFLKMCEQVEINLVAVDEAHCVSQWGNDFRPSYVRISAFIEKLAKRPCLCALTATATDDVRQDIIAALNLQKPYICVAGFDRKNLYFGVERPQPSEKDRCLYKLVKERSDRSGIIYCSTRNAVEEVHFLLEEWGYAATLYHAGLGDEVRKRNQEDFLFDRKPIMVATNAFGMGIDKSNVGFVIHYNMARDIESYYQEAGRAGRDGSPADCILIYNKADVLTANYFAECGLEERESRGFDPQLSQLLYTRDLDRVRKMTYYCTTPDCLRSFFLKYFGENDTPFRCEHCSSCASETEVIEATVEAQKIISCVLRLEQRNRTMGKVMIIDILRGSQAQKILDAGFESLSTYGIMKDTPKEMVYTLIDALVADGYLRVTDSKYPVVICTEKGKAFLKNHESFSVKLAKKKLAKKSAKNSFELHTAESKKKSVEFSDTDKDLFEELRAVRASLAREQGVAAFIIFHDSTLYDMCAKRPRSLEEFLEVSGVGKNKAEKYGEAFLTCISQYDESATS